MATNNGGKKTVEIKENPKKAPETPAANNQTNEEDVKYTFGYCLRHPIKSVKHAFAEHPVATSVVGTAAIGGLAFAGKCIVAALGGDDEDDTEDYDDVTEDEEEDDEEEI